MYVLLQDTGFISGEGGLILQYENASNREAWLHVSFDRQLRNACHIKSMGAAIRYAPLPDAFASAGPEEVDPTRSVRSR